MGHEGVDRLLPLDQRRQVHLEESRIEQKLEGVALPSLARVVVVGQGGQQLGRGEVARLVGAVVAPEIRDNVQQDGTQDRDDLRQEMIISISKSGSKTPNTYLCL